MPEEKSNTMRGAKIIDELLCLFKLYEEDYHIVDEALKFVHEIAIQYPEQPVTLGLQRILDSKFPIRANSGGVE